MNTYWKIQIEADSLAASVSFVTSAGGLVPQSLQHTFSNDTKGKASSTFWKITQIHNRYPNELPAGKPCGESASQIR
jgi:hypothetical protein